MISEDGPLGGTAICVKRQIGHRVASIPKPLVQEMGKLIHWRAKHRGIFQGVLPEDTGDTFHQSDD